MWGTEWKHDTPGISGAPSLGPACSNCLFSPQSDPRTPKKNSSGVQTIKAGRPEGEPSAKIQQSTPAEPDPTKVATAEEPGPVLGREKPAPMPPVPSSSEPGQDLGSPEPEEPGGASSASSVGGPGPVKTVDAGMLKTLVFQLVPAQQRGDPFFVPAFLNVYHRFATTHQVLDLLFER